MRVKKYQEFAKINEEFIFSALKGALAKLFQVFAAPFKDLANDFKKMFDPEDPNSVKNIILTNFDQAVDGVQKQINAVPNEGDLVTIFPQMVSSLIQLSQNLDKDIRTGLGEDKLLPVKKIAQVMILGNQEAKYAGIVGILDPNNKEQRKVCAKLNLGDPTKIMTAFKYNKAAYEKNLQIAGQKGGFEAKKKAAFAFFDNMQKEIKNEIEKELTEEEINKIYNTVASEEDKKKGRTSVKLSWGRVEIELNKGKEGWIVKDSNSKDLVIPEKGELTAKIEGEAKLKQKIKLTDLSVDGQEYKTEKSGENFYETGELELITVDGKKVQKYPFGVSGKKGGDKSELQTKLKSLKPEMYPKVAKFADFLGKAKPEQIAQVQKAMGGGQGQAQPKAAQ